MILVDTSVVIELVEKRSGFLVCLEHLQRFEPQQIHVSAITVFELEAGLFDGSPHIRARRARWQQFYGMATPELVFDSIATAAANIVRTTAKRGHQIGGMDALIAATAIENGLTIATRDADYDRIPGLKVERWV